MLYYTYVSLLIAIMYSNYVIKRIAFCVLSTFSKMRALYVLYIKKPLQEGSSARLVEYEDGWLDKNMMLIFVHISIYFTQHLAFK